MANSSFHHDDLWKDVLDTQTEIQPANVPVTDRVKNMWKNAHTKPIVVAMVVSISSLLLLLLCKPPFLFIKHTKDEFDDDWDDAMELPKFSPLRLVLLSGGLGLLILTWPWIQKNAKPLLARIKTTTGVK